eukprot:CAMPEP_0198543810 /NCGR_PEP_ID=MMETSP1462-20131121/59863_1 /TAXON_ID=1333877 /ORGANISM="Brandtodinium nutriculum, Strain RCC3387" /LENGTH=142 /DNA_ID=CAMNT_0044274103 /DNA_START=224 /DNA_END=649 /DNA_ORIENTATION=-
MMYFKGVSCNGSAVQFTVFMTQTGPEGASCHGTPTAFKAPLGRCMEFYGAPMIVQCGSQGEVLLSYWERPKIVPPPAPRLATCRAGAAAADAGGHSGSAGGLARVFYETDASVDIVSFEVSLAAGGAAALPTIHYTALASGS